MEGVSELEFIGTINPTPLCGLAAQVFRQEQVEDGWFWLASPLRALNIGTLARVFDQARKKHCIAIPNVCPHVDKLGMNIVENRWRIELLMLVPRHVRSPILDNLLLCELAQTPPNLVWISRSVRWHKRSMKIPKWMKKKCCSTRGHGANAA